MAYKLVSMLSDLPDLKSSRGIILDLETSGLDCHKGDRLCGIAIGPEDTDDNFYIPVRHLHGNLPLDNVFAWLRELTEDASHLWINHNILFDMLFLKADGIELKGNVWDTMVFAHVKDSDLPSYSLDFLTAHFCNDYGSSSEDKRLQEYLAQTQKKPFNYSLVPVEVLGPYALEDVASTRKLNQALHKSFDNYAAVDNSGMQSWGVQDLVWNEMQLVKILAEMQDYGIQVDLKETARLLAKAEDEMEILMRKMWALSGGIPFVPSEWKKMSDAFIRAGGSIKYWTKKEALRGKQKAQQFTENKDESTGRPNWNATAVLAYLKELKRDGKLAAYEFLLAYHEYGVRRRTCSTFLEAMLQFADKDSRVHPQLLQHGTKTGRLSSCNPNFEQLPKPGGTGDQKALEKFLGSKDDDALNRQIRGLVVAPEGKVIVSIDWSQLELRSAAYLSRDTHMLERWRNDPSLDYHQATVDLMGGKITRDLAKTVNFLKLYGGGAKGLASALCSQGIATTVEEAQATINSIDNARPCFRQASKVTSYKGEHQGYVQSVFGRRVKVIADKAYKGMSYLNQGQCGDLLRYMIVKVYNFIKEKNLPAKLLYAVHDELLFEIDEERVQEVAPLLSKQMCECPFWDVVLTSDVEAGKTWGSAKAL